MGWLPFGAPHRPAGDLLLYKPAGTIEKLKVDGYESRWLKMTHGAGLTGAPQTTPPLRLLINCNLSKDQQPAVTALEGIANTAPLVLNAGFYPFGREPRQFDSFYLGSKEALSKPSAEVTLHFALGDAVSSARAALALDDTDYLTFGISEDGRLQRMAHGVAAPAPNLTPALAFQSATQPVGVNQRPVSLTASLRPGAAIVAGVPNVSAGAGTEVWLWRRTGAGEEWKLLDKPSTASDPVTATLLAATAASLALYAIAGGQLYRRLTDDGAAWSLEDVGAATPVAIVAPVVGIDSRAGEQAEDSGIVAVTSDGLMYLRTAGTWSKVPSAADLDPTFYPLVVRDAGGNLLCVTRDNTKKPVAFELAPGATVRTSAVELIGHAVDFVPRGGTDVLAIISAIIGGTPVVAIWDGFHGVAPAPLADASGHQPSEAPVVVGLPGGGDRLVYVPGDAGTAFVVNTGLEQYLEQTPVTDTALFTDANTTWPAQTNLLIDIRGTVNRRILAVDEVLQTVAPDQWLFKLDHASAPRAASLVVDVYQALEAQPFDGTWTSTTQLTLDIHDSDSAAAATPFLSVDVNGKLRVVEIATVAAGVATLAPGNTLPSASAGDPVPYRVCQPPPAALPSTLTVDLRPAVDIQQLDPIVAAALVNGTLQSQDSALTPKSQTVRYAIAGKVAVLDAAWAAKPASAAYDFFAVVGAFEKWTVFEPPAPHNPTLSWEYYDGTAWRPIPNLTDTTEALAKAGDVVFCVPKDLKPTDVVGRTNSWIRARLVGGDYGQETVTVTTSPGPTAGTTIQTVNRNTDSIRAPYVSALTVTYQVCCAVVPDFVLARDNGMLRDETAVNRQSDALVDYFVPLGDALATLAGGDASARNERALFLGFDTPLTGEAIQILFLVDEGSNDDAYPLRVDVLTGDRFTPITTLSDDTRGLNESGVLELNARAASAADRPVWRRRPVLAPRAAWHAHGGYVAVAARDPRRVSQRHLGGCGRHAVDRAARVVGWIAEPEVPAGPSARAREQLVAARVRAARRRGRGAAEAAGHRRQGQPAERGSARELGVVERGGRSRR